LINREPSDSLKNQLQTEEEQWKNTNHIPTKGHAD